MITPGSAIGISLGRVYQGSKPGGLVQVKCPTCWHITMAPIIFNRAFKRILNRNIKF